MRRLFNVDLPQSTHPLLIYVKFTLHNNVNGWCDLRKQISSPWSFNILYVLLIIFGFYLKKRGICEPHEKKQGENWVLKSQHCNFFILLRDFWCIMHSSFVFSLHLQLHIKAEAFSDMPLPPVDPIYCKLQLTVFLGAENTIAFRCLRT